MIKINIGIYQSKDKNPRVDDPGEKTHCRILFREQMDPRYQYDTIQVFLTPEQLADTVVQSIEFLDQGQLEKINERSDELLDKLEKAA